MIGKQNPDLKDVFEIFAEYIKAEIFKIRIGEVKAFDPATQKATIELVIKPFKEYEDKQIKELPPILLFEVPLGLNAGFFGGITTPIEAGNYVSVFFTDTDNTDWFLTGEVRKSATTKKHDKNSCFFIPFAPLPDLKKLANYNNNAITLKKADTGEIKIGDNVVLMQNNANSKVEISNSKIEIKHNAGGKVEVDSKVKIANDNKDLKTILTSLGNALLNAKALDLDTQNYVLPLDPATISAINTYISDVASLLK